MGISMNLIFGNTISGSLNACGCPVFSYSPLLEFSDASTIFKALIASQYRLTRAAHESWECTTDHIALATVPYWLNTCSITYHNKDYVNKHEEAATSTPYSTSTNVPALAATA
jgi:hypothetical protein